MKVGDGSGSYGVTRDVVVLVEKVAVAGWGLEGYRRWEGGGGGGSGHVFRHYRGI